MAHAPSIFYLDSMSSRTGHPAAAALCSTMDDGCHGRPKNYGVLVVLTGKHLGRPPDLALLVGPPLTASLEASGGHQPRCSFLQHSLVAPCQWPLYVLASMISRHY